MRDGFWCLPGLLPFKGREGYHCMMRIQFLRRTLFLVSLSLALAASALTAVSVSGAAAKFFDDDPIAREPETRDASKAEEWDIDLVWDLALNLFSRPGDSTPNVRAQNINTIDEVP